MKLKVHGLSDVKGCVYCVYIYISKVTSASVGIVMVMPYVDGAATVLPLQ